jgi:hypothetical protein
VPDDLDENATSAMDMARDAGRRGLVERLLDGFVSGPAAATEATVKALAKAADARVIVLVEGVSDQIAFETLALRRGRDLDTEGVLVLPIGGAHALTRYLTRFGGGRAEVELAGLCDAAEEGIFRTGLAEAGFGSPQSRADLERLGFYVCVEDLEDELIRAVGTAGVEAVFDTHGDLDSFRTLQSQPAWRGQDPDAQMRRFLSSGARRKLRYARLLVESVDLGRVPRPLDALLAHV